MMAHLASPGLDLLSRDSARLDLIGRLKPGQTLDKARAELDWQPTRPSLVEEFTNGSYRTSTG